LSPCVGVHYVPFGQNLSHDAALGGYIAGRRNHDFVNDGGVAHIDLSCEA
jgi:hypothetical protein